MIRQKMSESYKIQILSLRCRYWYSLLSHSNETPTDKFWLDRFKKSECRLVVTVALNSKMQIQHQLTYFASFHAQLDLMLLDAKTFSLIKYLRAQLRSEPWRSTLRIFHHLGYFEVSILLEEIKLTETFRYF